MLIVSYIDENDKPRYETSYHLNDKNRWQGMESKCVEIFREVIQQDTYKILAQHYENIVVCTNNADLGDDNENLRLGTLYRVIGLQVKGTENFYILEGKFDVNNEPSLYNTRRFERVIPNNRNN